MGLGNIGGLEDEYTVKILAETSQARTETKSYFQSLIKGTDEASEAIDKKLLGSFFAAGAAMTVLGGLAVSVFSTILQSISKAVSMVSTFIAQGVQMAATYETLVVSFTNIVGSEETAVALLGEIREMSAALGQDWMQLAQVARRLIPFAQGDVDTFREMLVLTQQLAVLNPGRTIESMGRALEEAITGNTAPLARLLGIPKERLDELNEEFQDTGDIEAYVSAVSGIADELGASASDMEAFASTSEIFIARIIAKFKILQKIFGAPLLAVAEEQLEKFFNIFQANSDQLQETALRIGATMAAVLEIAIEIVQFLAKGVQQFIALSALADQIVEAVGNRITDATAKIVTNIVTVAVAALNIVIQKANQVADLLGLDKIEEVDFDASAFESGVKDTLKVVQDVASAITSPLAAIGQGLDQAFNIKDRVAAFEEQFKDMLDANAEGASSLGDQNSDFQEEDLSEWIEYVQEIRDVLEKHQKAVEAETEKHQEKLLSIDQKAADRRAEVTRRAARRRADLIRDSERDVGDARIDLARKLADIDFDAQNDRVQVEQDVTRQIEEIDEQHAENIRRIRLGIQRQLFDAVNARDARRVFDILQKAREGTRESGRDRNKRLRELKVETRDRLQEIDRRAQIERVKAEQNFRQNIEDIARRREERLADLNVGLAQELADIDENRRKQRKLEHVAHIKRMRDLNAQTQDRLNMVGRSWAEEGKITAEGVSRVMNIVNSVFGQNGSYINVIRGFNSALTAEALQTQSLLASMGGGGSATPTNIKPKIGPRGRGINPTVAGSTVIFAADGLEGIIRQPTLMMVGDNGPEAVSITPLNKAGAGGGVEEMLLRIMVDATDKFSPQFEAGLRAEIASFVGNSVIGPRRTRRK